MEQYLTLAHSLITWFSKFMVAQVLRLINRMANALTNLASNTLYPWHVELNVMPYPSIVNDAIFTIDTRDYNSWMSPIANYLKNIILLEDKRVSIRKKARATKYALINDVLYRHSFSCPYQRRVPPDETKHNPRGSTRRYLQ